MELTGNRTQNWRSVWSFKRLRICICSFRGDKDSKANVSQLKKDSDQSGMPVDKEIWVPQTKSCGQLSSDTIHKHTHTKMFDLIYKKPFVHPLSADQKQL